MVTEAGAVRTGVAGSAITVAVVLAERLGSSAEVAVMSTDPALAGAVQAPVALFMVPALADQRSPLVAPPVAEAVKVVVLPTARDGATGLTAPTATVWGARLRLVVAWVPAWLITVRVKVLAAAMAPLPKPTPVVTVPTAWSTVPVPPVKVGVTVVVPPKGTGLAAATRLVATGAATMVLLAVPGAEALLPWTVAMQLRPTTPEVPAVKVTEALFVAEEKVPLVMDQVRVAPAWAGVEAV